MSTPNPATLAAAAAPTSTSGKMLLGLIGAGIQRSLTPAMHEVEAAHHSLRLHYQLIDLDRSDTGAQALPGLIAAAQLMGYAGLNITYPCKQAVIPLLDELSDEAAAMGAVNTVVLREHRRIGHNTDGSGWAWGFARALPDADLSQVVLLGAGGAGAAIAHALMRLGCARLLIHDVDRVKATELADALCQRYGAGRAWAEPEQAAALAGARGLVHATPTGMDKLPGLALPSGLLRPEMWVSEVVYFPIETALLKAARAIGCRVIDGGGMAVGQAIGAFRLFTGREPDAARVDAHFRSLLRAAG